MKASKPKFIALYIGILVASAAVYAAPFLNSQLAMLAFLATAPWLLFIVSSRLSNLGRLFCFLSLIYLIALLSLNWLAGFSIAAWLISPLFYIPFFLPTFYVTRYVRTVWPSLPLSIIWGVCLTGTEWLRIWLSPGEIPFCQLAAALVPFTKLLQIVDVAGASALTTIAALAAGLIADATEYFYSDMRRRGSLKLLTSAAVVVLAFALTTWYGYSNDQERTFSRGPRLEVIQSNMAGWRDDLSSHLKLQQAIELTFSNTFRFDDVDLVVWPENSVVPKINPTASADDSVASVAAVARKIGVPVLFDGPYDMQNLSERHRAALVQPDGNVTSYAKQLFVPWSEYAPFEATLRYIYPAIADKYLTFIKSRNPYFTPTLVEQRPLTVFRYEGRGGRPVIFGAPICYEILNARLVNRWYGVLDDNSRRNFFLINQVNEILLGRSVHTQTLAFCQLRAVEGRVSIIRAANNGISAAVDPNGRVYDQLRDPASSASVDVAGVFFPHVILDARAGTTIYARFGDWWPITCLASSLALMFFGFLRQRRSGLTDAVLRLQKVGNDITDFAQRIR